MGITHLIQQQQSDLVREFKSSLYWDMRKIASHSAYTPGVWTTVYEVTGAGKVTDIGFWANSANNTTYIIRALIDDTKPIGFGAPSNASTWAEATNFSFRLSERVVSEVEPRYGTTVNFYYVPGAPAILDFTLVNSSSNYVCVYPSSEVLYTKLTQDALNASKNVLMSGAVQFNSSLKIQIMRLGSSNNTVNVMYVEGGIY